MRKAELEEMLLETEETLGAEIARHETLQIEVQTLSEENARLRHLLRQASAQYEKLVSYVKTLRHWASATPGSNRLSTGTENEL